MSAETAARALRADAQRNLTRILEAAREVFAEQGADASIADVAARAEVGTATIFRRFPTKDELIAAVIRQRIEEVAEQARGAAQHRDPGRAFRRFMEWAAATYIGDRGFCEAGKSEAFEDEGIRPLVAELTDSLEMLLTRAKEAGAIREDIGAADIPVLLNAVAQAGLALEHSAPGSWHRYLEIVLDGLRPEGAHALSRKAPALTSKRKPEPRRAAAAPRSS
jgi:AcrR family transcriptional regulator